MTFGEKVKELRARKQLSQREVAEYLGITTRAYQNYELHNVIPKKRDVLVKLSELYDVSIDDLLSNEELFYINIQENYGTKSKGRAQKLLEETQALLAGGDLTSHERDVFLDSLMKMYVRSKEITRNKQTKK